MQFKQVTGLLASLMVSSGALVTSEVEVEIGKTNTGGSVTSTLPSVISWKQNTPTKICR